MTLQWRADGAQDKHGLRSEPRPCELCGQLVVSVCDSLDMGDAVTCHYEPETEDEKAKRIAALEAENAALRQDAAVGMAIRNMPDDYALVRSSELFDAEHPYACYPLDVNCNDVYINFRSATVSAALAAAGLMEEEE